MKSFLFLLITTFMPFLGYSQQGEVVFAEYFFNTDPGFGQGNSIPITNSTLISFDFSVDISALSIGEHWFYYRVKDEFGKWSVTQGRPFTIDEIVEPKTDQISAITHIEYFIGNVVNGDTSSIEFEEQVEGQLSTDFRVPIMEEAGEFQTFNLKVRNAMGIWSPISTRLFFVDDDFEPKIVSVPTITELEYFYNDDPGQGKAQFISLKSDSLVTIRIDTTVSTSELTQGLNQIGIRAKNSLGFWSETLSNEFEIIVGPELLSLESDSLFYTEKSEEINVTDSLEVIVEGDFLIDSAIVAMRNGFIFLEDSISIASSDSVAISEGEGYFKLSGSASAALYQNLLRSVSYKNTSNNPSDSPKVITFQVFGIGDSSEAVNRIIKVIPLDDPLAQIMDFPFVELPEDLQDTTLFNLSDFFFDVDNPTNYLINKLGNSEEIRFTLINETEVRLSVEENWFGFDSLEITAKSGPLTLIDTVFIEIYPVFEVQPTSPEILAPTQNSEIDFRAFLIWSLSEDTVGNRFPIPLYQLQIDTTSSFSSPIVDQQNIGIPNGLLKTTTSTFSMLQASNDEDSVFAIRLSSIEETDLLRDDEKYYWRVRAFNEDSASVWSEPWNFWLNLENDAPFVITEGFTPADSITVSSVNPILSWNAGLDPDFSDGQERLKYIVELSSDADFQGEVFTDTTALGVNSVEADNLNDETIYFWKVRSIDDEGAISDWSSIQAFIINQKLDPPSPFALITPENGVDTLTSTPQFVWQSSSDTDLFDRVYYRYRISNDSLFNTVILETEFDSDTVFNTELDLVVGKYFWQVVAIDTDSLVTWASNSESEPYKFQIVQEVSNEMIDSVPIDFVLNQNYPNPFNPSTTLQFGLPVASEVRLEVFNMLGQKVATILDNDLKQAGWHSVQYDASSLSSGMYIYRIQAGDFVQTNRMLLIK